MFYYYLENSGIISTTLLLILVAMYISYRLGGNNWSSVKKAALRLVVFATFSVVAMVFFFIGLVIYFHRLGEI